MSETKAPLRVAWADRTPPAYRYRPHWSSRPRFLYEQDAESGAWIVRDRLGLIAVPQYPSTQRSKGMARSHANVLSEAHAPLDDDERDFIREYAEHAAGGYGQAEGMKRAAELLSPTKFERFMRLADRYNAIVHGAYTKSI